MPELSLMAAKRRNGFRGCTTIGNIFSRRADSRSATGPRSQQLRQPTATSKTSRGRQFRSAPILGAAAPRTADAEKFSQAHPTAGALRPGRPRSAKKRQRRPFPATGARPVPGRSSLGQGGRPGAFTTSSQSRSRCAPGRRALRFACRLSALCFLAAHDFRFCLAPAVQRRAGQSIPPMRPTRNETNLSGVQGVA